MSSSAVTHPSNASNKSIVAWIKKMKPAIWLAPLALFFYLFQLAPMIWVFINSFIYEDEYSFENYQEIFDSSFMLQGFSNSLWLSIWSSLISLMIATLLV